MITRWIVLIIGAFVALLGLSQIAAASWWLRIMPVIMGARDMRILGLVALIVGAVLIFAAARRVVELRAFVYVLGVLMLVGGALMLIDPAMIRDRVYSAFMSRPYGSQIVMARVGGLVRSVFGIALIWAVAKLGTTTGTTTGSRHAHA
jgi:hypothetical protein